MTVVQFKPITIEALTKQTKAAWDRADQKHADAKDWYTRTGKMLIELKEKVGHGNWEIKLQELGRSDRRAQELMEMARKTNTKTIEKDRERKRKSMQKSRGKPRNVARFSKTQQNQNTDSKQTLEERWQNSLANLCGDVIAISSYWNKEFPGWEGFECPSHIKQLMIEAATELALIIKTMET